MFGMYKTKHSSKDCNRCLSIASKIDILWSSRKTREFIINFKQVIKSFLVWSIYFAFSLSVVHCTLYKSNIKSDCKLLLCHLPVRSSGQEVFCKKAVLEVLQSLQQNTCARVSFLKRRLWYSCFPVNFAKFLRTSFVTEHLRWLPLSFQSEPTLNNFRTSCS